MLPPHCKSGTVIDLAAGSAVADQQAPSPVADQVVGSAVAEDKAPSPVAGQAVGPAVADHKAPSPVADQAVGSAVVGQNVPPPEAAAGCKAAAPLTIINNKKPPPSVPPPHTTAQAQIRVQPPGHESKEKKPPPPLPKRLITTNDTPVWASVQTITPKMTFRAPSVNRVCETPFAFFVPGRGIVMESRCKKTGEPLAAAAATELAPTRDARSSGHNDAQPSASNFGPAVAGPGTPPFSAEHFEKHRVARVTREQKHHNWALKILREEYAGSEQQFPATETMWCPEVFHPPRR